MGFDRMTGNLMNELESMEISLFLSPVANQRECQAGVPH